MSDAETTSTGDTGTTSAAGDSLLWVVVLPGVAAVLGYLVFGPVGFFAGLVLVLVVGEYVEDGGSDEDVERLQREVEELEAEVERLEAELAAVYDDGHVSDDGPVSDDGHVSDDGPVSDSDDTD